MWFHWCGLEHMRGDKLNADTYNALAHNGMRKHTSSLGTYWSQLGDYCINSNAVIAHTAYAHNAHTAIFDCLTQKLYITIGGQKT